MRHALITAGTKGLGLQVVEGLLEAGYSVTVTYFSDKEKAETLQQKWAHKKLQLVQADVTKKEDLQMAAAQALSFAGRIDLCIHNAGPYVFEKRSLWIIAKPNGHI